MKQIVVIEWLDSGLYLDEGWAPQEDYLRELTLDRMTVITSGILMHEDEEMIVVATSYDPSHDTYYGAQVIARSNVISVRVVEKR